MARRFFTALGAACVGLALAQAPAAAQSVTFAMSSAPTSVDPHYHTFTPNETLDGHIFDRLVERDAHSKLVPCLAL